MTRKERILPDGDLAIDFIICDNSVNRYGWRLLVEGIDLTGFLKNPVCCILHSTFELAVGKWENVRVDGDKLVGTLIFDRNDDQAVKLYWKYVDGYMSAVSLNILPFEESDDPKLLLPGQKAATITKSELLEISVVTVPGQKNAVKLSTPDGSDYKLNFIHTMAKEEKTIEQIQADLEAQKKLSADNLVKYHKARGVVQDGEVASLTKLALNNYEDISAMLDGRSVPAPENKNDEAETKADMLTKLHADRGAISQSEIPVYKLAAITDYEGTKKALEAKPGTEGLKNFVQGLGTGGAEAQVNERAGWTYYDYFKKDPEALALMEKDKPEDYKKLVADFERESKKLGIVTQQEA